MRKNILVVEDNPDLRDLLRQTLEQAGYAVATASNGLEALASARSAVPDLLLLDLVLPELNGFSVCEILRRERETAHLPIIVLTGLTSEFSRLAGLESGATDYLVKPFLPDQLVKKIKRHLRSSVRNRKCAKAQVDAV